MNLHTIYTCGVFWSTSSTCAKNINTKMLNNRRLMQCDNAILNTHICVKATDLCIRFLTYHHPPSYVLEKYFSNARFTIDVHFAPLALISLLKHLYVIYVHEILTDSYKKKSSNQLFLRNICIFSILWYPTKYTSKHLEIL